MYIKVYVMGMLRTTDSPRETRMKRYCFESEDEKSQLCHNHQLRHIISQKKKTSDQATNLEMTTEY